MMREFWRSTTKEERLRELSDMIATATIARRYAQTDAEQQRLNGILDRAYNEKYVILSAKGKLTDWNIGRSEEWKY